MQTATIVRTLVVLIVLGVFGWFFYGSKAPVSPTAQDIVTETQNTGTSSSEIEKPAPKSVTVVYGPDGFSPATVTISKGDIVTFENQGGGSMWVASGPHPTHELYGGTTKDQHCPDTVALAFDQCSVGTTYSFIFQKVGTWKYHNHLNAADKGTIIVQ